MGQITRCSFLQERKCFSQPGNAATHIFFQLFGTGSLLWKILSSPEDQSTKDTPAVLCRETHHRKHHAAGKGTGAVGDVYGSLADILFGAPLKAFAGKTGDSSVKVFCITCQRTVKSKAVGQHAPSKQRAADEKQW